MDKTNNSQMHKNHRLRRKTSYLSSGFSSFSDIEKLEFILFYSISQKDTNPLAHKLLDHFGSFDEVLEAPVEKLMQVDGIGEHTAILIHLFLDVMNEYSKTKCTKSISSVCEAKEFCSNLFMGSTVEEFYVICLSPINKVLACKQINKGSVDQVNIDIRKIVDVILNTRCSKIILTHNHPKGTHYPSDEDVSFTSKIISNTLLLNVEVIDHIIVSKNKQFSFAQSKMLKEITSDAIRKFGIPKPTLNSNNIDYIID